MAKEIKYGAEARAALESGVNQLADTSKFLPLCGSLKNLKNINKCREAHCNVPLSVL